MFNKEKDLIEETCDVIFVDQTSDKGLPTTLELFVTMVGMILNIDQLIRNLQKHAVHVVLVSGQVISKEPQSLYQREEKENRDSDI